MSTARISKNEQADALDWNLCGQQQKTLDNCCQQYPPTTDRAQLYLEKVLPLFMDNILRFYISLFFQKSFAKLSFLP